MRLASTSDNELIVNYNTFKLVLRFRGTEVERVKRGLILLTSKFHLYLDGRSRSWWDGLTKQQRAEIEADSDWLNDKITKAKLEHAHNRRGDVSGKQGQTKWRRL